MDDTQLLVGGRTLRGAGELEVTNPATGRVFARCGRADAQQLDLAVEAATHAQRNWAARPWRERQAALLAMAQVIDEDAEGLARLLTMEQGKPLAEARLEVAYTAGFFRYYGSVELPMRVLEQTAQRRIEAHARPLGVVGAITPWNFPLLIMAVKVPAALLAGNAVVLKPAPTTPLSTLRLAHRIQHLLPPGTLNVVTDANDLGGLLTTHSGVRKVSFTGSTATGKKVMASAAGTLKRITLELGGNDAAIVLDDVDAARVARALYPSIFTCAGQNCLAVKRLFVQRRAYEALARELVALAQQAVVGDGLAPETTMGPLQNRQQFERVVSLHEEAATQGRVLCGGIVPGPGYFIRPTLVADMAPGQRLVDEEQFGPVLPLVPFDDEELALAFANGSPYGLGGSVWSASTERAYALAARLEVGTAWVNQHFDVAPHIPFTGAKQSGLGFEFAVEGLAEYTQQQIINVAT
jgi:acyl-CoA reductase-like NAD-dependent aldehyde dehydrogenase